MIQSTSKRSVKLLVRCTQSRLRLLAAGSRLELKAALATREGCRLALGLDAEIRNNVGSLVRNTTPYGIKVY